jgi:hypothetical protein
MVSLASDPWSLAAAANRPLTCRDTGRSTAIRPDRRALDERAGDEHVPGNLYAVSEVLVTWIMSGFKITEHSMRRPDRTGPGHGAASACLGLRALVVAHRLSGWPQPAPIGIF